jgi:hypothetical protein
MRVLGVAASPAHRALDRGAALASTTCELHQHPVAHLLDGSPAMPAMDGSMTST